MVYEPLTGDPEGRLQVGDGIPEEGRFPGLALDRIARRILRGGARMLLREIIHAATNRSTD